MKANIIHVSLEKWRLDVPFVGFCRHVRESVLHYDDVIS